MQTVSLPVPRVLRARGGAFTESRRNARSQRCDGRRDAGGYRGTSCAELSLMFTEAHSASLEMSDVKRAMFKTAASARCAYIRLPGAALVSCDACRRNCRLAGAGTSAFRARLDRARRRSRSSLYSHKSAAAGLARRPSRMALARVRLPMAASLGLYHHCRRRDDGGAGGVNQEKRNKQLEGNRHGRQPTLDQPPRRLHLGRFRRR